MSYASMTKGPIQRSSFAGLFDAVLFRNPDASASALSDLLQLDYDAHYVSSTISSHLSPVPRGMEDMMHGALFTIMTDDSQRRKHNAARLVSNVLAVLASHSFDALVAAIPVNHMDEFFRKFINYILTSLINEDALLALHVLMVCSTIEPCRMIIESHPALSSLASHQYGKDEAPAFLAFCASFPRLISKFDEAVIHRLIAHEWDMFHAAQQNAQKAAHRPAAANPNVTTSHHTILVPDSSSTSGAASAEDHEGTWAKAVHFLSNIAFMSVQALRAFLSKLSPASATSVPLTPNGAASASATGESSAASSAVDEVEPPIASLVVLYNMVPFNSPSLENGFGRVASNLLAAKKTKLNVVACKLCFHIMRIQIDNGFAPAVYMLHTLSFLRKHGHAIIDGDLFHVALTTLHAFLLHASQNRVEWRAASAQANMPTSWSPSWETLFKMLERLAAGKVSSPDTTWLISLDICACLSSALVYGLKMVPTRDAYEALLITLLRYKNAVEDIERHLFLLRQERINEIESAVEVLEYTARILNQALPDGEVSYEQLVDRVIRPQVGNIVFPHRAQGQAGVGGVWSASNSYMSVPNLVRQAQQVFQRQAAGTS